jgi:hypothetical protein
MIALLAQIDAAAEITSENPIKPFSFFFALAFELTQDLPKLLPRLDAAFSAAEKKLHQGLGDRSRALPALELDRLPWNSVA